MYPEKQAILYIGVHFQLTQSIWYKKTCTEWRNVPRFLKKFIWRGISITDTYNILHINQKYYWFRTPINEKLKFSGYAYIFCSTTILFVIHQYFFGGHQYFPVKMQIKSSQKWYAETLKNPYSFNKRNCKDFYFQ